MIIIEGLYNKAKVFTSDLEPTAREQIKTLCDQPFVKGSKIRIMPDVHAGAGCPIGTTMTITDKVVPNLVGVDIGCGMHTLQLEEDQLDYPKLDRLIKSEIPSGFAIRKTPHHFMKQIDLTKLRCRENGKNDQKLNLGRARLSLGTLGGGNHFIEVNQNEKGQLYFVIHSGSRNIGLQVALHYQRKASQLNPQQPRDLAYLEGKLMEDYLHDMKIMQKFARFNRKAMADIIVDGMNWKVEDTFITIHNYIDLEQMMLRKGAISAAKNEKVLIPLNMRDGSLICIGKANPDWNESAPHGAGRIMSRTQARKELSLKEFHQSMAGIYTSSVRRGTLDESPMAYKPIDHLLEYLDQTAEILHHVKPTYNFKAS